MGDSEPVLVLDEEVPDGPVDGGGGEALDLALQHHVIAQRLHHSGPHSPHFRPEPGSRNVVRSCVMYSKNASHLTISLAVILTGGPTLLLASHTYSPLSVLSTLANLEMTNIKRFLFSFESLVSKYLVRFPVVGQLVIQ